MGMNKKRFISDYAFNLLRTLLKVIIPLITLPWVLNRIGPVQYGVFSYTNSIISYFTMAAVLGIPRYAIRAVAREKEGESLCKTTTEIYIIQFISVSIAILLFYLLFFPLFSESYKSMYRILSLMLVSSYLNVEWFYTGRQKFKYIAIRSLSIKFLNVFAILYLVRDGQNAEIYALITVGTAVLNGLINFTGMLGYFQFRNLTFKPHIKPIFNLFALSIAGLINANIDKTLTGALVGPLYVGYYSVGYRITIVIQNLFTALNGIISPRIISLLADRDEKKTAKLIKVNMDYIFFLAMPIILGLIFYGRQILLLLFDKDIQPAYESLIILAGIVPVLAILNILRQHIFLPRDKDKTLILLMIVPIVVNVLLNLIFVPRWFHVGAAAATLAANTAALFLGLIIVSKNFHISLFHLNQIKYILASLSLLLPYLIRSVFWGIFGETGGLFILIILSAIIYFLVVFLLGDDLFSFYLRKIIRKNRK